MRILFSFTGLLVFLAVPQAMAGLGDGEENIPGDAQALHGEHTLAVSNSTYRTHHITNAGHTVKEFAGPNNHVFGVSWTGTTTPNFKVLFGTYFPEYQKALASKAKIHGRAPFHLETEHLIVEIKGRPGALIGHAIIKDQMPQGMDTKQLQ